MLTERNKTLRMKYALAQIDRSHGRKRIRFKDNKRTIMVDESWFYLTSDAVTVLLIEDMDVLIHPKDDNPTSELSGSQHQRFGLLCIAQGGC